MNENRQFTGLQAAEIYCPRCRAARPVREHLLLVLPTGNKYEYRCAVCAAPLGSRDDGDDSEYRSLVGGRRLVE